MTGHTTLVLGGARSGKSAWAEHHAGQSGRPVLYVATAAAGDDEMAERIARHRAQRPETWRTVEEPERLLQLIELTALPGESVVVDCLTLWVSNVLLAATDSWPDADAVSLATWTTIETSLLREAEALLSLARERDLDLILVSNEVGLGIVPGSTLGRRYRDALGRVNQAVAGKAESVVLMVAGLAIDLRQLASQNREAGDATGLPAPDPDHR